MRRAELTELHFITPIANLASIAKKGILCHDAARKLKAATVAMPEIQSKRAKKSVPRGMSLHQYANLYFHARNPMMFVRRVLHLDIAVLRVAPAVLDLSKAIIADGNAASGYTGFWPSPDGLARIDRELTFAEDWRDLDQIVYWQKKQAKCAEVLVPGRVDAKYITGVYASCAQSKAAIDALGLPWQVTVNSHMFFQG